MNILKHCVDKHWRMFTAILMAAVGVLSLLPAAELPEVPGSDKTHHFIAYAALALPVAIARPARWLLFVFGFLLYSGAIEVLQPFVNRYGEWQDLFANALGLLLGVTLSVLVNRIAVK